MILSSKAFLIKNKIKNRFATAFLIKLVVLLAYRKNNIFGRIVLYDMLLLKCHNIHFQSNCKLHTHIHTHIPHLQSPTLGIGSQHTGFYQNKSSGILQSWEPGNSSWTLPDMCQVWKWVSPVLSNRTFGNDIQNSTHVPSTAVAIHCMWPQRPRKYIFNIISFQFS